MWRRGGVTTTMWNEDDDGVPMASYYLYDGINEVPPDVTESLPPLPLSGATCSVLSVRTLLKPPMMDFFLPKKNQPVVLLFEKSYYPKDCVASKNGPSYIVNRSQISSSLRYPKA